MHLWHAPEAIPTSQNMENVCNRSSPNRMRSSAPRGGNSTQSSVSQVPRLGFSWVDGSLLEGSAHFSLPSDITARPSGKLVAAEREGCNSLLVSNGSVLPASWGPFLVLATVLDLNWLRKVESLA